LKSFLGAFALLPLFAVGPVLAAGEQLRFVESNHASEVFSEQIAQSALGSKVMRVPLTEDKVEGLTWTSFAIYAANGSAVSDKEPPTYSLMVVILHSADRGGSWNNYQATKLSLKGEDVPGVGEAACQTNNPQYLIVFKGNNTLLISAQVPPTKTQLSAEKQVAIEVCKKL
jgi:hypothetical protein